MEPNPIELDDLTHRPKQRQQAPEQRSEDNFYIPAVVLGVLGFLLSLFPGFVSYLGQSTGLSPLERFLSIQFGVYLLAVAVSLLLNTESHPLLVPLTAASSISSFLAYNTYPFHSLAALFFIANLVVALAGYVAILFSNEYVSKTTGADKCTSAFIFGNKSAASKIKKTWKAEKGSK
ncbi:hypothetical protein BKA70DRAFT_1416510 [Coprinopsis sp. MPI-PUGE-AT-0042]|nr:hypothetical protein BKA70DRAFT_1416510 [Coprinopsis sp. MPI-PUGE-AT-0042]